VALVLSPRGSAEGALRPPPRGLTPGVALVQFKQGAASRGV